VDVAVTAGRDVVVERLQQLTRRWGAEPAIEFDDRWLTWADVGRLADVIDGVLAEHGVAPGVAVTIVMRQRPGTLIAELAALRAGRPAVLLSSLQSDAALVDELRTTRPAVVVLDAVDFDRPGVAEAVAAAGSLGIELSDPLRASVRVAGAAHHHRQVDVLLDAGSTDMAVTVLTSGTTGRPKRLPVAWDDFVELGGGSHPAVPQSRRSPLIVTTPLVTLGGLLSISRLVFGGRPISLIERFDVHAWAALVKRHRPTIIGAPPPVVKMVLDAGITPDHFDGVTAYVTSSAAIAPDVIAEFVRTYRIPVLLSYGATEFLGSVTGWTDELWERYGTDKLGSVGRAKPGVQLRVVDPQRGEPVAAGTPGVLEVDPPLRAGGLGSGWIRTSDRARIDDDGFVWILGRTDDVIVRGGFKVDLDEVEQLARRHPRVAAACAVGLDDARLGSVPALVVTVSASDACRDAPPLEPAELTEWLRLRLPPYAVPTDVRVVEAIPTTSTLKPDKAAVRAMLAEPPD